MPSLARPGGRGSATTWSAITPTRTIANRLFPTPAQVHDSLHTILNLGSDLSPALSPLPSGKDFPLLHFSWLPQNVPTLPHLRPQVPKRGRLFPRRHVHQLWPGPCSHRADRSIVVGHYGLVDYKRRNLGGGVVPAAGAEHFTFRSRSLDLPGSNLRSRTTITSHVGADVPICPAERSSAIYARCKA